MPMSPKRHWPNARSAAYAACTQPPAVRLSSRTGLLVHEWPLWPGGRLWDGCTRVTHGQVGVVQSFMAVLLQWQVAPARNPVRSGRHGATGRGALGQCRRWGRRRCGHDRRRSRHRCFGSTVLPAPIDADAGETRERRRRAAGGPLVPHLITVIATKCASLLEPHG